VQVGEEHAYVYASIRGREEGCRQGGGTAIEGQERDRGVGGISYLFGMIAAVVEDRKNFDLFALCCC
jgi:hypothetical protein